MHASLILSFHIFIVILLYCIIIMGATKTDHFTDRQNRLATVAKALGHPARMAIIDHLLKVNACICNDLVAELPLAQATVSQHLKELKAAGLIKGEVEGNSICYCIDAAAWAAFREELDSIFTKIDSNIQTCC